MCNLYSITTNQTAIIELTRALRDVTGNLPPMSGVFPDYKAPIVRNAPDSARELAMLRWGMPSSSQALFEATERRADKLRAKGKEVDEVAFKALLKAEPDKGTTNIRSTKSKHWTRWLGVENRCVVPFTSFSEFNKEAGGDIWFALDETRPLAVFAGVWTNWTSVRKVKEGETTNDLYGFAHKANCAFVSKTNNSSCGPTAPSCANLKPTTSHPLLDSLRFHLKS